MFFADATRLPCEAISSGKRDRANGAFSVTGWNERLPSAVSAGRSGKPGNTALPGFWLYSGLFQVYLMCSRLLTVVGYQMSRCR